MLVIIFTVVTAIALPVIGWIIDARTSGDSKAQRRFDEVVAGMIFAVLILLGVWLFELRSSAKTESRPLRFAANRAIVDELFEAEEVKQAPMDSAARVAISTTIANWRMGFVQEHDFDEISDYARHLLADARDSALATSYINPSEWWERPDIKERYGRRPDIVQRDRVIVRRIFIVATSGECDTLRSVAADQRAEGIDVQFTASARKSQSQLRDMLIVDGRRGVELELAERRFSGSRLTSDTAVVKNMLEVFRGLYNHASKDCKIALRNR